MRLDQLLDHTGLSVLDHLEREVTIPVLDGIQAQGDLIVIPAAIVGAAIDSAPARWVPVSPQGVDLLRATNGANPHTLVGAACHWTTGVRDTLALAVALVRNTEPAYLIHPEHGGTGIAPGYWIIRRQRELGIHGRRARPLYVHD
ncbi:hypothetical protein [Actinokineospora globicatena]|uniref:hypothetical protein n=1 Tax=Actinokineospora globicatena TaxID=103729 RepID=UPI0020A3BBBC|nr:hypothetical protein [Actinokineospora globicatena]MCP2303938.1 hypothetical protein [Actinokineospora globicatena]GLW78901.1 hypothetical protein Aglo01_33830 [Actinokineospora globicatena]GLW86686.1 hypothetical protein Aglo02_43250 [Actinokineospora globicatena]